MVFGIYMLRYKSDLTRLEHTHTIMLSHPLIHKHMRVACGRMHRTTNSFMRQTPTDTLSRIQIKYPLSKHKVFYAVAGACHHRHALCEWCKSEPDRERKKDVERVREWESEINQISSSHVDYDVSQQQRKLYIIKIN